jgi:type IV pilus assembly protein PilE
MEKSMKQNKGFSLIELLIVVSVISILAAVGIVFYGDNVIAGNRTEGRSALATTAGSLEKCRSLYGSYNNANCNVALPFNSDSNFYTISAAAIASSSFTLTATPVAGEPQAKDSDCTSMSLTNTGIKTGTGADPTACW